MISGKAAIADDIENADPTGQTVEFWVQYSDERLDAMKARAERFEAKRNQINVVYKGHYGKVQSAMMSSAGTKDIADVIEAMEMLLQICILSKLL